MTLSIAYLLLEIIAPSELRNVFYDFSDRLFFKFLYRPISNLFKLLKESFIKSYKQLKKLLLFNKTLKEKRIQKKDEKRLMKNKTKEEKSTKKKEKRDLKLYAKLQKKQNKLQNKIESRELKAEIFYKIKMFLVNKFQNKEKSKIKANIKNQKREEKLRNKLENKQLKAETNHKIKVFLAYKAKKIINKLLSK